MADDLHLDVAGIKQQLLHIASSIDDLKESLVPLKELSTTVGRMEERYTSMQRTIDAMVTFRESTTDFVARAKGGLAVALFLITVFNGLLAWGVSYIWGSVTQHETKIQLLEQKK